ncbi:hypothetical protein [Cellvibrio sp. PSBB023]|uniref:hypothetical protein n=1 Tax=Cellvibrio sp. PSBB023 TaxID=1945512 RepID=UPI001FEEF197|nr:hypothetical protein [Cellvibrio sp. PSBB023]
MGKVKQLLAAEAIVINGETRHFYVSIGVTDKLQSSLDQQIATASQHLRHAKEAGGNMIVDDGDDE